MLDVIGGIHVPYDPLFVSAIGERLEVIGFLQKRCIIDINLGREFPQPVQRREDVPAGSGRLRAARARNRFSQSDSSCLLRPAERRGEAGPHIHSRNERRQGAGFPEPDLIETIVCIIRISVPDKK